MRFHTAEIHKLSYATITLGFVIGAFYNKMCRQIANSSFAVWTRFLWVP